MAMKSPVIFGRWASRAGETPPPGDFLLAPMRIPSFFWLENQLYLQKGDFKLLVRFPPF